jgi:hypothetical protein
LVRKIDLQLSHLGSNPHRCRPSSYYLKNIVGASPTTFILEKNGIINVCYNIQMSSSFLTFAFVCSEE